MKRWDCVIKRLPKKSKIIGAEIGVFKGKMSYQMLKRLPGLTLFMIDRWEPYSKKEQDDDLSATMAHYNAEYWKGCRAKVEKMAAKFGDRAQIIISDSVEAASRFGNGTFDYAFVDAGHGPIAAAKDLCAWLPKIKKGGLLCGHDITRRGVKTAVAEILGNVETDDDKTWFWRVK